MRVALCAFAIVCFLPLAANADVSQCREFQKHGRVNEAAGCYRGLTRSSQALDRALGYGGLQQYQEANTEFQQADRATPNSAVVKTEWGNLYREHAQPGDAAKLFEEAIEADANYAPAYLGLARVLSENFDKKAVEIAQNALKLDPKLYQAHALIAYMALEDSRPNDAVAEANKALAVNSEALDGLSVLASIDWLNGKQSSTWMDQILKINPRYGEAYAAGAHFFVINYRYDDAIAFYRKALDLNPSLWAARSQLGVNLMRLGFADEARQELTRCYEAHFRDPQTVNSLRLLDTRKNYQRFQTASTDILLDKKEAGLLYPYVQPELERAIAAYQRKYKMTLAGPVHLEIYPNHEDFVVRTLGLPGQGGLLGVTFGMVVAMDSPSARAPGELNWAETIWHELSHVYVVTATHGLVPRWFTEGLAVHEESTVAPGWGDRLTPDVIVALKDKKLLPVEQLDRGFVRPEYPNQVLVSYYEAGKICDYITEKYGDAVILEFVHAYAERKTSVEAIHDVLHESPESFDKNFLAWLEAKNRKTLDSFDAWKQGMQAAQADLQKKNFDEALKKSLAVHDDYPDYIGAGNAYETIANIYVTNGKKTEAARELELYRDRGGRNVDLLNKLAQLEIDLSNAQQAQNTLQKLIFICPEDEEVHRKLGNLALNAGNSENAVREYRAVLILKPQDMAESHFDLARALAAAHKENEAKDELLAALETAPNYKPAQKLLLELSH
jgi:tetratricopeptide (TPR) repeat protein